MKQTKTADLAAKALFRIVSKTSKFLLPAPAGLLPESYVRSIEENLCFSWLQPHVEKVVPLLPAKVESYAFPDDFPVYFRRQKAFDPLNAFLLRDVIFDPLSGGVWLPDGKHFLGESVGSINRVMLWSNSIHRFWGRGRPAESDRIVVPVWGRNYYHFMLEELPRALHALKVCPDACLVASPRAPGFVHDILRVVLRSHPGAISCNWSQKSRVDRLLLVSAQEHSGFTRTESLQEVVKLLPEGAGSGPGRKLYLSRKLASGRQVENEPEIEMLFKQNGYEAVYLERYPVVDQWKLLNSAAAVAGFSGAGFANAAFCRPGTRVCCIFKRETFIDCFARLAVQRGLGYSYVNYFRDDGSEWDPRWLVETVTNKQRLP